MKVKLKAFLLFMLRTLLTTMLLLAYLIFMVWLSGEYHEACAAEHTNEYQSIIDTATEEDLYALECVVYWESVRADCDYEVSKAVVETVMNRVLSSEYPNTISKVCKQRGQFVCKPIPVSTSDYAWESISDAIEGAVNYGREILPSADYVYFASKKQSYAKGHIWVGDLGATGKPLKGKGMYFGKE